MVNAAAGGNWIARPPVSVEVKHVGADAGQVPGFVTVTSSGPRSCGFEGTATRIVIEVPSVDTVGLAAGVTSLAAPPKRTVAPGRNRLPMRVNVTCLAALGSVVTLPGTTAPSTGVVTMNTAPLLTRPLVAATVTLPVMARDGTVIVRDVEVAAVTVAAIRIPPAPWNVTELPAALGLKPGPAITTVLPRGPDAGVRRATAGGVGGVVGTLFEAGGASPLIPFTISTGLGPTALPPSELITLTS